MEKLFKRKPVNRTASKVKRICEQEVKKAYIIARPHETPKRWKYDSIPRRTCPVRCIASSYSETPLFVRPHHIKSTSRRFLAHSTLFRIVSSWCSKTSFSVDAGDRNEEKNIHFQKYLDTSGQGLRMDF